MFRVRGKVACVISLLAAAKVTSVVMACWKVEVQCLGCREERAGKVILVRLSKSVGREVSFFHYSSRAATCF